MMPARRDLKDSALDELVVLATTYACSPFEEEDSYPEYSGTREIVLDDIHEVDDPSGDSRLFGTDYSTCRVYESRPVSGPNVLVFVVEVTG